MLSCMGNLLEAIAGIRARATVLSLPRCRWCRCLIENPKSEFCTVEHLHAFEDADAW